jgi:O-antigen/teichoic acid export membrane protein
MATNAMLVVSFSILARLVTPVEMGEMAVLLMVVGLSRVIVCLGMPRSVTRFIAESMAKNDRMEAAAVFYQAIKTNLLLSLLAAVGMFLWSKSLSTWLLGTPERAILFQLLAFDIVVAAGLLPTLSSAMLGLQKIREMSLANLVYTVARQSLIAAFVLASHSLLGLVMAWIVSEIGLTLMFFRHVESSIGLPVFTFDLKRLVRFSFPIFLQDAANYVYTWFDRAVLLTYLSLESLGTYTTAMTAFGVLANVADAIGMSLFPTYSVMREEHGREALGDSIREATRYACLIGLPLCFGLFSTAKPSLALFVGEAYAEATGPLMVISLFASFAFVETAFTGLLVVLGETVLSLKLATLQIAVGVASTLVLLPSLKMVGASIARGITMATSLVTMMIVLRRRISVEFDTEAFWKSLVSSGVMATVVLLFQTYYYSKYLLPAYVVVGGFIYLSMLFVLRAIRAQDVQLLDEYLGPRLRFITRLLRSLLGTPRSAVSDD